MVLARYRTCLLGIALLSLGCEIHHVSPPDPPRAAPAAAAPGDKGDATALRAGVAIEVAIARGIVKAVGGSDDLTPRSRRAHQRSLPLAQQARRELHAARYRGARAAAHKVMGILEPVLVELSARERLAEPMCGLLVKLAKQSSQDVDRAARALHATSNSAGAEHYHQAKRRFQGAAVAAEAGESSGAFAGMKDGLAALDRAIALRWPKLASR